MVSAASSIGYGEMTALVSGGTAGTGLAVACALVQAGVRRVALTGRDPERGARARSAVASLAPDAEVLFIAADATDAGQVERAVDRVAGELGGLDVAVSSVAPAVLPELLHASRRERLAQQLVEIALPAMLLTHAASEVMRERRGGSIVLLASDAAKVPTPGEAVVGAAIGMYGRVAAVEGGRHGIRVNTVTPSLIEGTATSRLLMEDDFSRRLFEKALARAPLGVTLAEDVAALVSFLAGPGAARTTGQTISVNGGLSAF